MKRLWIAGTLILTILISGCSAMQPVYRAGIYEGNSEGYYSNIHVEVIVDEYHILEVTILDHDEIQILADIVFEEIPPRIMKRNGTDVDSIAGATYTSRSLLRAVEQALEKARIQEVQP